MIRPPHRGAGALLPLLLLLSLPGCLPDEPFETEPAVAYESFGTELFGILRTEAELASYKPESKAGALDARRDDLIWALDKMVERDAGTRVLATMEQVLPLYDDLPDGRPGPIPSLTRDLARFLEGALGSPTIVEAMAEVERLFGPAPTPLYRLLNRLSRSPVTLADPMLRFLLERRALLRNLFSDLAVRLDDLEAGSTPVGERLLGALLEPVLKPVGDLGPPALIVRLDSFGQPALALRDGHAPAFFLDADGDGRADRDGDGILLRSDGGTGAPPAFSWRSEHGEGRDSAGRALGADGQPLYRYEDARHTALGYLLLVCRRWVQEGLLHDLPRALRPLLGPEENRSDERGTFEGFDPAQAPIALWLEVLRSLAGYDRIAQAVAALVAIDRARPDLLPGLVADVGRIRWLFGTQTLIKPENRFLDDMLPHLAWVAESGKTAALLKALADPRLLKLKTAYPKLLQFTTLQFPEDTSVLRTPSDVDALPFGPVVDRSRGDDDPENRSIHQRLLELINDTNRAPFAAFLGDPDLGTLPITDNLAALYVDSLAGVANMRIEGVPDELTEAFLQIVEELDDMTPTPEQLNLFLAHEQALIGNPICNQGFQVRLHQGMMLAALQRAGGIDALAPLAEVFALSGHSSVFVDMLTVMHEHYATTASSAPGTRSFGTGLRNAELELMALMGDTPFLDHLQGVAATAQQTSFELRGETLSASEELAGLFAFLLRRDPELSARAPGPFVYGDGAEMPAGAEISRFGLILQAMRRSQAAIDADPAAREAWDRLDLAGPILALEGNDLANPRAGSMVQAMLRGLAPLLEARTRDLDAWRADLDAGVADTLDFLGGRSAHVLVRLAEEMAADPKLRDAVDGTLLHLLNPEDPSPGADGHAVLLQAMAWLAEVRADHSMLVELARWVAGILREDVDLPIRMIEALDALLKADPDRAFLALVENLTQEPEPSRIPLLFISDAIEAVIRLDPGSDDLLGPADMAFVIQNLVDYLWDGERGFERLYQIVRSRK